ncbi:aldo/keto reductase [Actibacterium sp. XHP0104]|uniref:aldo/keto reductase n=1 Tax=Actibacterium sp. XHP0104 TaxID=2984335 RepID=UPI0021E735A6|nr:aldo/keto reductase [Actibacterium sp. XHP0104]MCV2881311.1 aldo/keto reductase [Actibacterium sp. XHP0104]
MRRTILGDSGIKVSAICLGSMTWGTQNTQAEGHTQIDRALDRGVNFIDTAEMYPVNPASLETAGGTEEIIGNWFARTGRRGDVVLATKVTGKGSATVKDGPAITPDRIRAATEASLRRLQSDYIDLCQFHWPNRGSYHFRQNWAYDPSGQDRAATLDNMQACLETLAALVTEGKIRAFGLSNETAWGTAQWLRLAGQGAGPRAQSVQNEYSLLCRFYDLDMAELGHNEQVTLLAYSPLAGGLLTGKYAGDVTPEGSRRSLHPTLHGRITPRVWEAVSSYLGIAHDHGLDPVQMAIAWIMARPFPVVPIIGATSMDQLETALGAADLTLSDEVQDAIEEAHKGHPMPY